MALLVTAGACAPHYVTAPPQLIPDVVLPEASITKHVVLVSVDGLRPDAIGKFDASTLRRLMQEGSYTLTASTILPSKTLPSHTSMLTSQPPARHGVLWNNVVSARARTVESPTIFSVARSRGYRTAAFFSKPKFEPLQRPGTLDYSQAPGGWFGGWSSDRTVGDVGRYLDDGARPNVLFVHLREPDRAGHRSGWMSAEYGRAVGVADAAVAGVLAVVVRAFGEGNVTVIVTADHGGHGYDHGSADPRDVAIPWIAWGRGVKSGETVSVPVRTMDTASTVLWLLGLEQPADWTGRPVVSAFHAEIARADARSSRF